ncbi:hypothetical protein P7L79_12745 [Tistrella mobilis]|uniref:hypothetical protein n=1 Tax=Tistrella mobilis TaxID=171437 RepID=UPI0035582267
MDATPKPETLPGILAVVARLINVGAAMRLAETYGGGQPLYIPRDVRRDHDLARLLGWRQAQLVCRELGGEAYPVPSMTVLIRSHRARELRRQGRTYGQIARQLRITQRHAARLASDVPRGNGGPEGESEVTVTRCPTCGRPYRRRHGSGDDRQLTLPGVCHLSS